MDEAEAGSITCYAHSREARPKSEWEMLEAHLECVAALAARHGEAFQSAEWARLAGLWHDLGKYRPEFLQMLRGSKVQVEHAGLGAALAVSKGGTALPIAFAIAGHHAGLANKEAQGESDLRPLVVRLAENTRLLEGLRIRIPPALLAPGIPSIPPFLAPQGGDSAALARKWELWTRFLFSALVDADRLAGRRHAESKAIAAQCRT